LADNFPSAQNLGAGGSCLFYAFPSLSSSATTHDSTGRDAALAGERSQQYCYFITFLLL